MQMKPEDVLQSLKQVGKTSPELERHSAVAWQLVRSLIETAYQLEHETLMLPERVAQEQLLVESLSALRPQQDETPSLRKSLRMVLDEQIRLWRKRMDAATTDAGVEAAGHYIDAHQYVREVFFGEQLGVDDDEQ